MIASARASIRIASPYFLPDLSLRQELTRAVRERGVRIQLLTVGPRTDLPLIRWASRRLYGHLLKAGVEIHELQTAMMHAKLMTVDGIWCGIGSTNIDRSSFRHNDEVNLAVCDPSFTARVDAFFSSELRSSQAVSLAKWSARPWHERVLEWATWPLKRQT